MRVKTESQRESILDAAIAVFREDGYDKASMSKVSRRLGGSKGTLYNYFSSKEELFSAAMLRAINQPAREAFEILAEKVGSAEIPDQLYRFGEAYLQFYLAPDSLEITRLALSEGRKGELGVLLYNESVKEGWKRVAVYLESSFNLPPAMFHDYWQLAMTYRTLLSAELTELRLRGLLNEVDEEHLRQRARHSTDILLKLLSE